MGKYPKAGGLQQDDCIKIGPVHIWKSTYTNLIGNYRYNHIIVHVGVSLILQML